MSYEKLDHPDVLAVTFHPRREDAPPHPAILDYDMPVAPDVIIGARLHLENPDNPTILFFHGNGEIASDYDAIGRLYNKHKMNFIAVDYRGYGRSTGTPTVTHMMSDAHTIFAETKQLLKEKGYNAPLFIMGRSLGSSCAIELAAAYKDEISGLLIDSGFAETLPLLTALGVDLHAIDITEEDGFRNAQKIATIDKPTFILHGQFDQIIPIASVELLQSHSPAKNKQFQIIPGADHNSIIEKVGEMYFAAIRQFFDKVLKVRPKRYTSRRNVA